MTIFLPSAVIPFKAVVTLIYFSALFRRYPGIFGRVEERVLSWFRRSDRVLSQTNQVMFPFLLFFFPP